ncbi:uncharacterized protein BP5553_08313 [Venustampulla echinocandica]|uniref:Uncharacterized protein n=1 Tax=Venustampulla echinocandica TaxID=2656787 RepID=A0A370TGD3_9HELO|nr:uncharacterized protein BP5553_08313 [Venustampulla echinocandica]RDL33945.1 hypothetical protein BP5553_08313 [Venustampulla echinocandica]
MLSTPSTLLSSDHPSAKVDQSSSTSSTPSPEQSPSPPPQFHQESLVNVNDALYKISDEQDKLFNEEIRHTSLTDRQRAEAIMKIRSVSMNASLPIYLSVSEPRASLHAASHASSGGEIKAEGAHSPETCHPDKKRILRILLNKDDLAGNEWMIDMALGKRTFISKKETSLGIPGLRGGFLKSSHDVDGRKEETSENEESPGSSSHEQGVGYHYPTATTVPTESANRGQVNSSSPPSQPQRYLAGDKELLYQGSTLDRELSRRSIKDNDSVNSPIRLSRSVDKIIRCRWFEPKISGFGPGISYLIRWAPAWVSEEKYWSCRQTAIGEIYGRRDGPDGREILVTWNDSWVSFEGRDTCSMDEVLSIASSEEGQYGPCDRERIKTWVDEIFNTLPRGATAAETLGLAELDGLSFNTETSVTLRGNGLASSRKGRRNATDDSSDADSANACSNNTGDEKPVQSEPLSSKIADQAVVTQEEQSSTIHIDNWPEEELSQVTNSVRG